MFSQALVSHQPHYERQQTIIMGGYEFLNAKVEWDLAGDDLPDNRMITVHVLAVWSSGADSCKEVKGLLLQPTGERQGQYRRQGVYLEIFDGQSLTKACESACITQKAYDLFSRVYFDQNGQEHYVVDLM
jgi:hypothetical protein